MTTAKWVKIWENRDIASVPFDKIGIKDLLKLSGFDKKYSNISEKQWYDYVYHVMNCMNVHSLPNVPFYMHEVGCGPGTFLKAVESLPISDSSPNIFSGNDISPALIEIAKKVLPDGNFEVCDAMDFEPLNLMHRAHYIVSHSVFQYFESYEYAEKILEKMHSKSMVGFAVLDVPMMHLKSGSEERRRQLMGEEYDKKYSDGLQHLYYPTEFFANFASKHRLDFKMDCNKQHILTGYENAMFRYDFYFTYFGFNDKTTKLI